MSQPDYNLFIAEMMRFASSTEDPNRIINKLLEYICKKLDSDRAYIFEENAEGGFDNTYEYCREGVTAEKDNLQNVPYKDVIEIWYNEYRRSHNILIYDVEEYKKVSVPMYEILKPQNVHTLVTGPIEIDGKYVGFYGVDNPPVETMENISSLIDMMEFIFGMLLRIRDYTRAIALSAKQDALTGCWNRKALDWIYEEREATSVGVLMCDLNGLKKKNDEEGHIEGDRYICKTAELFAECFGKEYVYRLGGDEFIVLKKDVTLEEMQKGMERLEKRCREENVSISLGLAHTDSYQQDFEKLLHEADERMYEAKSRHYRTSGAERRRNRSEFGGVNPAPAQPGGNDSFMAHT